RKEKEPTGRYACIPSTWIWFPAKLMIPNALAILFYPLYTFGYQFDMLAVRTADHGLFADLYVVSYQSSGYHGAFFNYDTGHEDAVNDLCAGADFSACK